MSKRRRIEVGPPTLPDQYAESSNRAYDLPSHNLGSQYLHSSSNASKNSYGTGLSGAASDFALEADMPHPHGSTTTLAASMPSQSSVSQHEQHWDAPQQPYSIDGYAGSSAFAQQSQQPYFSSAVPAYGEQGTDPRTYNTPWPPSAPSQTQSEGFPIQRSGTQYAVSLENPEAMPYLGTVNDAQGGVEGGMGISIAGYEHNGEAGAECGLFPDGRTDTGMQVSHDASMQLKNQSLSILDNLATQLIQTTAKLSVGQMQEILCGSDTEEGQAYKTLKSLFEQTRKVYSRETPFVDAIAIQMIQPDQQEIIRKANIATFISSVLVAHDVGFFHLNEYFVETFVPLGHRLLKWQGAIFLELKTQAYISALINSDGDPRAMLDELFPPDLDAQILRQHPDAPSLSPSEQDFIGRCRARKSYLLAEGNAGIALKELPKKYQWSEFMREFADCIRKNADTIMNAPVRNPISSAERRSTLSADAMHSFNTSSTLSGINNTAETETPRKPSHPPGTATNPSISGTNPRQPWTKPEEDALLSGLDRVNGPHWSQILALYGRGGSVSEVLKDRNQVQLKDKARNLKLRYLKEGREVPVALRGVTGELGKRGGKGARAALGLEEDEEDVCGSAGRGEDERGKGGGGSARRKTKKGS